MSRIKKLVVAAAVILFATWLFAHWNRVTGDADATIRFSLGVIFALLVMLRRKDPDKKFKRVPQAYVPIALGAGVLGALSGTVFRVHMLEWAGVLLLMSACLVWVVAPRQRADMLLAMVILFWVHPLPGQIFGWLQSSMQHLSVSGSETILHGFNVRVWGDGIVLRTGYQNFLVPEVCSGMRTAVTVFLCALGVGLLLRLRWYETLFFIVLGLGQVLVLNISRISFMVLWAPRMPPEWAEHFLHDSLGIFLMGAIALVQFEAAWWRWWSRRRAFIREGVKNKELEPKEKASIVPHALRRLVLFLLVTVGFGLIGFGTYAIIYKSRAYHRKEMIREVALGLIDTNPASAERAIKEIRALFPEDRELMVMQANTDFMLGRFEEGLIYLEQIEAQGEPLELRESVMKGWAMMRVGRLAEARELVDSLGQNSERIPGVAMLRAEFAAMDGEPAEVSRHIVTASLSHLLLPRIRALFPYLARHEQWGAIASADHDRPYRDIMHALIALYAQQQQNDLAGLIRVMEQTLKGWPDDPRLLGALFEIASQRRTGDWESRFESNLRANLMEMNADMLMTAASWSWRLMRPDLAWLLYLRMTDVSPNDPELVVAPARYGGGWTFVRRHQLSVPASDPNQTISVLPMLDLFAGVEMFDALRERIPMLDAVRQMRNERVREAQLEAGLNALEALESTGPLSRRLMRLYPMVLAMLERYDEAHDRLDRIVEVYPELEIDVLFQHAVFYDQQQRWAHSYEALREYAAAMPGRNLTADLMKVNALMNLDLGVCAMETVRQAKFDYPGAIRLILAESAIWDVFGFKAQALHVLEESPIGTATPVAAALFEATGRLQAADGLRTALGLPPPATAGDTPLFLSSASLVLEPRWPEPMNREELEQAQVAIQEASAEVGASPFIDELRRLMGRWYAQLLPGGDRDEEGKAEEAMVEEWAAAGRSRFEQLGSVYQLAMLAARDRDYELARAAIQYCRELYPQNAVVWRALIALEPDKSRWVPQAFAACPEDGSIMLGQLVVLLQDVEAEDPLPAAVSNLVSEAVASRAYSVETLVRAGTHLVANQRYEAAIPLAKAVEARSNGLLAAHVLAMRVAMMTGDADWAINATLRGIELAQDKVPFYRTLVDLKVARREVDNDLLEALEFLQANEAETTQWGEALGALYFQRGDMRRALTIFGSVIEEDIRGVRVQTLLLAAEAARLENRLERAIRILEAAYAMEPDRVSVLNNLVYLLAQRDETLPRARQLLPLLLEMGDTNFAVMDTAAMVALRSGDLDQAATLMAKAKASLDEGQYGVHEVRLNAAELAISRGQGDEARIALDALRRDPERPDHVDRRARQLLRELDLTIEF